MSPKITFDWLMSGGYCSEDEVNRYSDEVIRAVRYVTYDYKDLKELGSQRVIAIIGSEAKTGCYSRAKIIDNLKQLEKMLRDGEYNGFDHLDVGENSIEIGRKDRGGFYLKTTSPVGRNMSYLFVYD